MLNDHRPESRASVRGKTTPAAMEQMGIEEPRPVPELARVDGGWGAWTYLTAATGLEVGS